MARLFRSGSENMSLEMQCFWSRTIHSPDTPRNNAPPISYLETFHSSLHLRSASSVFEKTVRSVLRSSPPFFLQMHVCVWIYYFLFSERGEVTRSGGRGGSRDEIRYSRACGSDERPKSREFQAFAFDKSRVNVWHLIRRTWGGFGLIRRSAPVRRAKIPMCFPPPFLSAVGGLPPLPTKPLSDCRAVKRSPIAGGNSGLQVPVYSAHAATLQRPVITICAGLYNLTPWLTFLLFLLLLFCPSLHSSSFV